MKELVRSLILGKDSMVSGIFALLFVSLVALGCTCGKNFNLADLANNANSNGRQTGVAAGDEVDDEMPDDRLLMATVRVTTAQFANSISKEDFSEMYEKASPDFKATYTEDQMKEIFKDSIANKRRLLPTLAKLVKMEPELTPAPYLREEQGEKILVVTGKYDTKPIPLNFTYEYVKHNGTYKLLKLLLK